jgi:hypothetical protein
MLTNLAAWYQLVPNRLLEGETTFPLIVLSENMVSLRLAA